MRVLPLIVILLFIAALPAAAAPWRITHDRWSVEDEAGFSNFVTAIGDSGCSSSESCLRSSANRWAASEDHAFLDVDVDCAKLPYLLRAYYAWKNGLPFSYVDAVSGTGDPRYSQSANVPVSRTDIVDRGSHGDRDGINGAQAMRQMLDTVFTATYRTDAGQTHGVLSDFYSPAIQPNAIRSGTVIYDTNGHVGIVYRVDASGRIYYMDAHPDFTVTRSVYGAQFGQSPQRLGGGLKNWRPLLLAGAHIEDGALIGGHAVMARNDQIADFSLVQYHGTDPSEDDRPHFSYRGVPLGFYEYVRVSVSGGKSDFNPVYELESTMRTLCNDLEDRRQAIDLAVEDGVAAKLHPDEIPANIYMSDDSTWESYATPARDARLRAAFVQFHRDLSEMIGMWIRRDPRIVYDGQFLKNDLLAAYDRESQRCTTTYLSSARHPVSLTFDDVAYRLFALSFDPYNCVELRWGDDRSSCPDETGKRRWYRSEQQARNEIGRDEQNAVIEISGPQDVDIRGLITSMPERVPFVQHMPGG